MPGAGRARAGARAAGRCRAGAAAPASPVSGRAAPSPSAVTPVAAAAAGRPWTLNGSLRLEALQALPDLRGLRALGVDDRLEGGQRAAEPAGRRAGGRRRGRGVSDARDLDSSDGNRDQRDHEREGDRPQAPLDEVLEDASCMLAFSWFMGSSPPRSEGPAVQIRPRPPAARRGRHGRGLRGRARRRGPGRREACSWSRAP